MIPKDKHRNFPWSAAHDVPRLDTATHPVTLSETEKATRTRTKTNGMQQREGNSQKPEENKAQHERTKKTVRFCLHKFLN